MKILIVEDEPKVAQGLKTVLTGDGFEVLLADSVDAADGLLQYEQVDLIILDRMLPGADGLDLLRKLRGEHNEVLVLVLTARDTVDDRVAGLESGADDYLVKPFAVPELMARVHALVRRGSGEGALHLTVADLSLDRVTKRVARAGEVIELTDKEYRILEYLMLSAGRYATREMITRHVWGFVPEVPSNVVAVHVASLRRKVDGSADVSLIQSVRGLGYVLRAPAVDK
jgi:DNA-binding response OmpR family regulator